jgi:hypothetical protein
MSKMWERCEMSAQMLSHHLMGRGHLGNMIMDGKIILKWILKGIGLEDVDWIHLAQDGV